MALKSGDYPATLDDKGRISIPSRFRDGIPGNVLILTKGLTEHCIWAMTPENWELVSSNIKKAVSMSLKKADMIYHRLLFSTYEVELDKAGRVAVPQKLRDFAGLRKDCTVTSDGVRIEIWDDECYADYERESDEHLTEALEEMGSVDLYKA